jgi:hypothetical protein
MPVNLLVLYEIADRASRVRTKKALKQFERWIKNIMQSYHDAAVEKIAKIYLFKLQAEFGYQM